MKGLTALCITAFALGIAVSQVYQYVYKPDTAFPIAEKTIISTTLTTASILPDAVASSANAHFGNIPIFFENDVEANASGINILLSTYGLNGYLSREEIIQTYDAINLSIAEFVYKKLISNLMPNENEINAEINKLQEENYFRWLEVYIAYFDLEEDAIVARQKYLDESTIHNQFVRITSPSEPGRKKISYHELAPNIQSLIAPMDAGSISPVIHSNSGYMLLLVKDSSNTDVSSAAIREQIKEIILDKKIARVLAEISSEMLLKVNHIQAKTK